MIYEMCNKKMEDRRCYQIGRNVTLCYLGRSGNSDWTFAFFVCKKERLD